MNWKVTSSVALSATFITDLYNKIGILWGWIYTILPHKILWYSPPSCLLHVCIVSMSVHSGQFKIWKSKSCQVLENKLEGPDLSNLVFGKTHHTFTVTKHVQQNYFSDLMPLFARCCAGRKERQKVLKQGDEREQAKRKKQRGREVWVIDCLPQKEIKKGINICRLVPQSCCASL